MYHQGFCFVKGNTKKGVDQICPFAASPRLHYHSLVTTQLLAFLGFFSNATFYKTEESLRVMSLKLAKGQRRLLGIMLMATWLAKIMLKLLILNNDKYKLQYTMNKIMEVKMKEKSVYFKRF